MRRPRSRAATLPFLALSLAACTQILGDFTEGSSTSTSGSNGASQACQDCLTSSASDGCKAQYDQCISNNQACSDIWNCINDCNNAGACVQACPGQFPDGQSDFNDVISCFTEDCKTACN